MTHMTQNKLSRITRKADMGSYLKAGSHYPQCTLIYENRGKQVIFNGKADMQIVKFINTASKITSGDIQRMFKISRQASHKETKALINLGVIKPQGVGRATYYILD